MIVFIFFNKYIAIHWEKSRNTRKIGKYLKYCNDRDNNRKTQKIYNYLHPVRTIVVYITDVHDIAGFLISYLHLY